MKRFLIAALILASTIGAPAQDAVPAKDQGREALLKQVAIKRKAYIRADLFHLDTGIWGIGMFISGDGLALLHLQPISLQEQPKIYADGNKEIPFGKILAVFPEQEMALMKFEHQPKTWVPLAKQETTIGKRVALIPIKKEAPWDEAASPVIGPILAQRISITPNLKTSRFVPVMSLGAGMTAAQKAGVGPGCFALNETGELVGLTNGSNSGVIHLTRMEQLVAKVDEAAGNGAPLGFPLSDENNPVDLASMDDDFHPTNLALSRGDYDGALKLTRKMSLRYPDSQLLKRYESFLTQIMNPDVAVPVNVDDLGAKAPVTHQLQFWAQKANALAMKGKLEESLEARDKAIELSPKGYDEQRVLAAHLLAYLKKTERAEEIYREVYDRQSDKMGYLELYEELMIKMGKIDEADKLSNRIYELRDIYRVPLE